jgi:hypothetical protein
MEPVFPVYVLAKDDDSIHIFHSTTEMKRELEAIDVENNEYKAWDGNCIVCNLSVQKKPAWLKIETSGTPEPEVMRQAILKYIDRYSEYFRPDKKFNYDKNSSDYIGIINKMKKHISEAHLKQKIINFFRRF